jgi:hypothetical protein
MIYLCVKGGLGNQLFQIFTTVAYALREKQEFTFSYYKKIGNRETYWDSFLCELKKYTNTMMIGVDVMTISEPEFCYNELSKPFFKNIHLYGYFQSYKYFEEYKNEILEMILFQNRLNKMKSIYYTIIDNVNPTISIHFRIGDYVNLPKHYHILKYEYYFKALTHIIYQLNNVQLNVLYFCEEGDVEKVNIIINQLKENLSNISFIQCPFHFKDWEQMLFMSSCNHNIIANSTFSWWGAYLNQNNNKIVCYPSLWFEEKNKHLNTKDLFPESWIKI